MSEAEYVESGLAWEVNAEMERLLIADDKRIEQERKGRRRR